MLGFRQGNIMDTPRFVTLHPNLLDFGGIGTLRIEYSEQSEH